MRRVRRHLKLTQSENIAEALSTEPCHIVPESSPPDYVRNISRYLESSVGQSSQELVCYGQPEADSDSGDSLFITQKLVPEAVRSRRRRHYSLGSDPTSPRDPQKDEDGTSSSQGESKTAKRMKRKSTLPKFSFPFLTPRRAQLTFPRNTNLHNSAMGGFFQCVRDMWQGYRRGHDQHSSLPTVDMDGENISPLSEDEERSESEDIRVVERKRFVAPSKAKCSKPWYIPEKGQNDRKPMSQGCQRKMRHKTPTKASTSSPILSSDTDDGDPSHRAQAEGETPRRSILCHTDTPVTKRHLITGHTIHFQSKEREGDSDSDATVCDLPQLQGSPREYTPRSRGVTPNVTEPSVFHTADLSQTEQSEDEPESQSLLQSLPDTVSVTNNHSISNTASVEKKKKADHESVTEAMGWSQEGAEEVQSARFVNVEVECTPSLSEDNRAEYPAMQTSEELQVNGEDEVENVLHDIIGKREEIYDPDPKRTKKRIKKNKPEADDVGQEGEGHLESELKVEKYYSILQTRNEVDGGKEKKKKKRRRSVQGDECVEQSQFNTVSEPLNEDADSARKKKQRKKEKENGGMEERGEEEEALDMTSDLQMEEMGHHVENTESYQERLEANQEKKRKKHKKKQLSAPQDEAQVGAEDVAKLSISNNVTSEESTGQSGKKKKKKKKRASISEEVGKNNVNDADSSQTPKEVPDNQDAEVVSKKKKKKEDGEIFSRTDSEYAAAQSDDLVSARKKQKRGTTSFLVADAEGEDWDTQEEQSSSCSKPVAAGVWGAGKAGVSAGAVEAESAEKAGSGNWEGSDNGVRKRKKKPKLSVEQQSVRKDPEQDFVLPAATDEGVKRKKKPWRNESDSSTEVERLGNADDAGLSQSETPVSVKKKKKKTCKAELDHEAVTEKSDFEGVSSKTWGSVSHETKGQPWNFPVAAGESHCHRTEVSHGKSTPEKNSEETLNTSSPTLGTLVIPLMNGGRDVEKNKKIRADGVFLVGKVVEAVEAEAHKSKGKGEKERNVATTVPCSASGSSLFPKTSHFETSFSEIITKNKHKKAYRRLHTASQDFFADF